MTRHSIGMAKKSQFHTALERQLSLFEKETKSIRFVPRKTESMTFFDISNTSISPKSSETVISQLARHIAIVLANEAWPVMIMEMIDDLSTGLTQYEKSSVLEKALQLQTHKRKQSLEQELYTRLYEHLSTCDDLVLEGFLRFRVKDIIDETLQIVEHAISIINIEKEYQEFIILLRKFVELQNPKLLEVHVLVNDAGENMLLDDSMQPIGMNFCEEDAETAMEMSGDDIMISSLITIAPSRIILHNAGESKNQHAIDTISKVFRGRTVFVEDKRQ